MPPSFASALGVWPMNFVCDKQAMNAARAIRKIDLRLSPPMLQFASRAFILISFIRAMVLAIFPIDTP